MDRNGSLGKLCDIEQDQISPPFILSFSLLTNSWILSSFLPSFPPSPTPQISFFSFLSWQNLLPLKQIMFNLFGSKEAFSFILKRKCSQHPRPSVQVNTRGLRSRRVPWFQNPFRPHLFESEVSRMHTAVNMCVCFHFSLCILGNGCVCPPALLTGGGSGSPFQVQRRQLSAGQLPNKTFCQEARVGGRKNPNKPVLQARCCHCFSP